MANRLLNQRIICESLPPLTALLREMIGFAAQRLMELEVEGLTGAAHGDRSRTLPARELNCLVPPLSRNRKAGAALMNVKDLLFEFGRRMGRIGLGRLAIDIDGMCSVIFDTGLEVKVETTDDEHVQLTGVVGRLCGSRREPLYQELLSANLHGRGTGGAVLALDETHDEIVLFRRLASRHIDVHEFEAALEAFVSHLQIWAKRLALAH